MKNFISFDINDQLEAKKMIAFYFTFYYFIKNLIEKKKLRKRKFLDNLK